MEKQHFEILLEKMENNFRLAFEGFDGVNRRLDCLEAGQSTTNDRLVRLEAGLGSIKVDVRDIKRTLRDHLDNHS